MKQVEAIAKLISGLDIVRNQKEKSDLMNSILNTENTIIVGFVNAHAINLMFSSKDFFNSMSLANILLRDGKGLEILLEKAGKPPGFNMNGTDFIPEVLSLAKGKKISIYGTQEPWLSNAVKLLKNDGHLVVDYVDGFREFDYYIERTRITNPDLIILAMGMPIQEALSVELAKLDSLDRGPKIICGGAIIDFMGGRFERAPYTMRKYGLEWLYRWWKEPRRLLKRYIWGNIKFLIKVPQIARLIKR